MRKTYRIIADIIAIDVVIQAMAIVFATAGLFKWIDDGETLDSAVIDSWENDPPTFTGSIGYFIHGVNGMLVIPLLGVLLLVVSFFAKVPGGVKWAAIVAVLIVVQFQVGIISHEIPALGLVHGLNAFALFAAALMAARSAKSPVVDKADTSAPAT